MQESILNFRIDIIIGDIVEPKLCNNSAGRLADGDCTFALGSTWEHCLVHVGLKEKKAQTIPH